MGQGPPQRSSPLTVTVNINQSVLGGLDLIGDGRL